MRDVSLQTKLTALAATAITLAVTIACVIFVFLDARRLSTSKATELTAIAEMLGTNSTAAVAFGQTDSAEDLLRSTKGRDQILVACILDSDQKVFAIYKRDGAEFVLEPKSIQIGARYTEDGYLDVAIPIVDDGEALGTLYVRESTAELSQSLAYQILAAGVVLAISIVVGVFASSHLQEFVTAPILRLASAAEQVSQNEDYSIRVRHESEDEIGVLYRQFNGMLERVESREKAVVQASQRLQELNQDLEQRVTNRTSELEKSNAALQQQIKAKDAATRELRETHIQLLEVSRRAGMADIANGVLHNIGNVLNSLNISANLIDERVRDFKCASLQRAIDLLKKNEDELADFLTNSDQGKILPRYLDKLSESMKDDQRSVLAEVESLAANVEHIKDIVRAQQSHAGAFGVMEQLNPATLFEDAIYFVHDSFSKHKVEIIKAYEPVSPIEIEKSKAIQIIVNLIKNAKESVLENGSETKQVTLRLKQVDENVCFQVTDSGIGIASDQLTTIFSNGYTTKKEGHGFGLHASAIAATELGGKLTVHSDGIGQGATFTLMLPASFRIKRAAIAS
ncbi:MAG: HAMP domain-containing protein [Planctomycetales bacterium]|nr:HAMP domain-containing protein [Planctomycetales bacterium]